MQTFLFGQERQALTDDFVYDENIRTILFYPNSESEQASLNPPVIPLSQPHPLVLEFDDLSDEYRDYIAKIEHRNADWSKSDLLLSEYTDEINEIRYENVETSVNTKVPYLHYTFKLPVVKVSGNYLVNIYRNYNDEIPVITRRFIVFENAVGISAKVKKSLGTDFQRQQVDFELNYPSLNIADPMREIKVVLRQNHRWDNAKKYSEPLYFDPTKKRLQYNYFDGTNSFLGGREYRSFDTRSLVSSRSGVETIDRNAKEVKVKLDPDRSRNTSAYTSFPDINGKFLIDQFEFRDGSINGDYVWVRFTLESAEAAGNVYVFGALSDWRTDDKFLMTYRAEEKGYTAEILLKQGYYNYLYLIDNEDNKRDEAYYEGSFFETENLYDLIVYYSPIGARFDRVIGYQELEYPLR